jgi:hypothetical protein
VAGSVGGSGEDGRGQERARLAAGVRALGDEADALSGQGRYIDALRARERAIGLRREMAVADPGRYLPELATALFDMTDPYASADLDGSAFRVAAEALAIRRELAAADPGRYLPDLADGLSQLGVLTAELRHPGRESVALTGEAIAIYRDLAAADPRYRSDLAVDLTNVSRWLAATRPAEALPLAEEAVRIRRDLSAVDSGEDKWRLPSSLTVLADILARLGRDDEAARNRSEAAALSERR